MGGYNHGYINNPTCASENDVICHVLSFVDKGGCYKIECHYYMLMFFLFIAFS